MRRLLSVLGIGIILFCVGFTWVMWLSPEARSGTRNWHNSYRMRPGMSQREALAIMGPALVVEPNPFNSRETIYNYQGPPFAASEVGFSVGPDSLVLVISHGDD